MRPAALFAMLFLVACYGDMVSIHDSSGGTEGPDAGGVDPNLDVTCADPQATMDDGHHYPGEVCGSCHNGSVASKYTVAGTLFSDVDGTAPIEGATVHVIDADGMTLDLVTGKNGNFHSGAALAAPVTTYVSSCPNASLMPTLASSGDCNSCHETGMRIALNP